MSLDLEERAKRAVGRRAVETYVRPGMRIGLGTGSTAFYAIERVGELVAGGCSVRVVATSRETEALCERFGIALIAYDGRPLDVAIDGADEIAPDWSLIKGGGGALFREKAVALAAETFAVIVTERKLVATLGAFALPVETVPYALPYVEPAIAALGARVVRRMSDTAPYVTDNGNAILDCNFGTIPDAGALDAALRQIHGVVATGLFVGLTSCVLVARADGEVDELIAPRAHVQ